MFEILLQNAIKLVIPYVLLTIYLKHSMLSSLACILHSMLMKRKLKKIQSESANTKCSSTSSSSSSKNSFSTSKTMDLQPFVEMTCLKHVRAQLILWLASARPSSLMLHSPLMTGRGNIMMSFSTTYLLFSTC